MGEFTPGLTPEVYYTLNYNFAFTEIRGCPATVQEHQASARR
ncbi:unannotated protein [freshwater metagenome]|uniref:Unannotated protein n=1 Tax=freshwater metagenome TaxID=449393 RepID=A0A6J6UIS6_9ZZZZ